MKKIILLLPVLLIMQGCFNTNINQPNEKPLMATAEAVNNQTQKLSFNSISFSPDKKMVFFSKSNNSYDNFFGITKVDESYWLRSIDKNDTKKLDSFKLTKDYYLEKTYWSNKDTLILIFFDHKNTKVIKYDLIKGNFSELFTKDIQIGFVNNNNLYFTEATKLKKFSISDQKESELAEFEGDFTWGQFSVNKDENFITNDIGVFQEETQKFTIKAPPPYYQLSKINLNKKSIKTNVKKPIDDDNLFEQKVTKGFSDDGTKLGSYSNKIIEVVNTENDEILFKKEFQNAENSYSSFAIWINNQQFIYKENKKLIIYDLEKKSEVKTIDVPEYFNDNYNIRYSGKNLILENKSSYAILNLSDYSIAKVNNNIFTSSDTILSNYLPEINETIFNKYESNDIYIIDENNSMKKIFTL